MRLEDLPTPCALVDLTVLERNAARMARRAREFKVRLRPHVKTHKCLQIARLQVRGHFGGITVSTMAEATAFAAAGFRDITYAVPIAPQRLPEAGALSARVDRFAVLVDHPLVAGEVESCAEATGAVLGVFLKVDCGGARAGVDPTGGELIELTRRIHGSPHLELRGLLTHAGHSYGCRNRDEVRRVAAEERDLMVTCAGRVREAGVVVPEISIGSTPSCIVADRLDGIDEIRPGNYVFFDTFQAAIGICDHGDVALTVLATVIGCYPERRELLVNAGALALSKDAGPVHVDPECGYGVVTTANGSHRFSELRIVSLSQEHGLLRAIGQVDLEALPPGTLLRILPNHSCLTAALFDRYHVVRDDRVVDEWRTMRGW